MGCELCSTPGGQVLWDDPQLRVVHVDDPDYHGYCRVIWNTHVAEMTDLDTAQQGHFMRVVLAVEASLRELLRPDKINLASLGNFTPHLHWHVVARFRDDAHFPQSIWSARQRESAVASARVQALPQDMPQRIKQALLGRV